MSAERIEPDAENVALSALSDQLSAAAEASPIGDQVAVVMIVDWEGTVSIRHKIGNEEALAELFQNLADGYREEAGEGTT